MTERADFRDLTSANNAIDQLRDEYAQMGERVRLSERALEDAERDARWIVGQWQRLKDEPVKEVAIAIVERCREALPANHPVQPEGAPDDR